MAKPAYCLAAHVNHRENRRAADAAQALDNHQYFRRTFDRIARRVPAISCHPASPKSINNCWRVLGFFIRQASIGADSGESNILKYLLRAHHRMHAASGGAAQEIHQATTTAHRRAVSKRRGSPVGRESAINSIPEAMAARHLRQSIA